MLVHARKLGRQLVLVDAVMMVEPRLGAPANVQRRMHVLHRPVHDALELGPVVHILEIELLNGRARDNQTIEVLMLDLFKRAIERLQMVFGHVRRLVARRAQQLNLDLQRGVGQLSHYLRLGSDLGGHEVQNEHAQRADILVQRAILGHDEDVLALKRLRCGQRIGNANGHGCSLHANGLALQREPRRAARQREIQSFHAFIGPSSSRLSNFFSSDADFVAVISDMNDSRSKEGGAALPWTDSWQQKRRIRKPASH